MALYQPSYAFETEEERRRRLQREQQEQGLAPISPDMIEPAQVPAITPPPTETPTIEPTQVAGPATLQRPSVAPVILPDQTPQPTPQPQVAQPAPWQQRLNTLNMEDRTGLYAFAGDKAVPEDIRNLVGDVLARSHKKEIDNQTANDLLIRAAQGETKAVNTLMRDLRRPEGSYLKAILYNRLGLTELAKQEQEKLSTDDYKITQSMVDNKPYTVKTDSKGQVLAAWDNAGIKQGEDMLAKISAGGLKPGGQIYGFTGGTYVIPEGQPNAGQEYRQRTNSQTGAIENVLVSGPNAGKLYTGSPGIEKRVESQGLISLNDAAIKFQTAPTIALATRMMELAGQLDPGDNSVINRVQNQIRSQAPQIFSQMRMPQAQARPEGAPVTAPQAQAQPAAQQQPPRTGTVPPPPPVAGGAPTQPRPQAQPAQQPRPAIQAPGAPSSARVSGGLQQQLEQQKSNIAINQAAAVEGIQVAGKRSESFNKYLDDVVAPESVNANTIVSTRKKQFGILDRPGIDANKLFGLYNAAQDSPGDQKLSIVRDIFGGIFRNPDDVSRRLAELNLTPAERSALIEFNSYNQDINAATLKKNAGAGSVSEAEQRVNKEANVDIGKIPALGAYNIMAQTQFDADKNRYKADWAVSAKHNAQNTIELEREWRKESQRVNKHYEEMSRMRASWLAANGVNNPNAVREAYRKFPVPEYDPETGTWKKTKPLGAILGK